MVIIPRLNEVTEKYYQKIIQMKIKNDMLWIEQKGLVSVG